MSSIIVAIFDAFARIAAKYFAPPPELAPAPKPLDPAVERAIAEARKRRQ